MQNCKKFIPHNVAGYTVINYDSTCPTDSTVENVQLMLTTNPTGICSSRFYLQNRPNAPADLRIISRGLLECNFLLLSSVS